MSRPRYRTSFMLQHELKFPEGDFFFEDNVLHWRLLLRLEKVALGEDVVAVCM